MNFILAIVAAILFVLCGLKWLQSACPKSARGLFLASSFTYYFSFETFLTQLQNFIFDLYNQTRIPAFRTVSLKRSGSMCPVFI